MLPSCVTCNIQILQKHFWFLTINIYIYASKKPLCITIFAFFCMVAARKATPIKSNSCHLPRKSQHNKNAHRPVTPIYTPKLRSQRESDTFKAANAFLRRKYKNTAHLLSVDTRKCSQSKHKQTVLVFSHFPII